MPDGLFAISLHPDCLSGNHSLYPYLAVNNHRRVHRHVYPITYYTIYEIYQP